MIDGTVRRGFPPPSGRLEFWSSTLAAWGCPEHPLPGYIRSHVHPAELAPGQVVLLSTFPLPTHLHTRSATSKSLHELPHTHPVSLHPPAPPQPSSPPGAQTDAAGIVPPPPGRRNPATPTRRWRSKRPGPARCPGGGWSRPARPAAPHPTAPAARSG